MPAGSSERVLRGGSDEKLIQSVVEKVLASEAFIAKIVAAMKQSFESQINEIKKEYNEKVSLLEKENFKLQDNYDSLEQYSRSNNIRIFGIQESDNENVYETVIKLCNDNLEVKIANTDIDVCHRLPSRNNQIKPIIVKFTRRTVKDQIYNAKRKLKGTRIVIREDLTRKRQDLVKMAAGIVGVRNVFTRNGSVFIKRGENIHKICNDGDLLNVSLNG